MREQNLDRFVGIPYKFLGTGFDGADCIGLCQLFFYEHGIMLEWRDGRPIDRDWYVKEPYRMVRWFYKYFDKLKYEELQYGDVVLFEINGEGHTGICVGSHKVLTILEQFKKSMIMRLNHGNVFFKCGFRLKKDWK